MKFKVSYFQGTSLDMNTATSFPFNYNAKSHVKHDTYNGFKSHKYKNNNHLSKIRKKRYEPKKVLNKFIKNITMKRHTTRTYFDTLQMSEPSQRDKFKSNNQLHNADDKIQKHNKFQEPFDEQIEKDDKFQAPIDNEMKTVVDKTKRNIKDVYYKAVHDATKYTEKTSMHPRYTSKNT